VRRRDESSTCTPAVAIAAESHDHAPVRRVELRPYDRLHLSSRMYVRTGKPVRQEWGCTRIEPRLLSLESLGMVVLEAPAMAACMLVSQQISEASSCARPASCTYTCSPVRGILEEIVHGAPRNLYAVFSCQSPPRQTELRLSADLCIGQDGPSRACRTPGETSSCSYRPSQATPGTEPHSMMCVRLRLGRERRAPSARWPLSRVVDLSVPASGLRWMMKWAAPRQTSWLRRPRRLR
jgi:hypothetical protein